MESTCFWTMLIIYSIEWYSWLNEICQCLIINVRWNLAIFEQCLLIYMYGMVLLENIHNWCKQNLVGCMSLPTQLMYNIRNLYKEEQVVYPIQITRIHYINNTLQGSMLYSNYNITLHKEHSTRQHYTLHKQDSMLYSNYKITLHKEYITQTR